MPRVGRLAEESAARARAEEELRTSRDLARIAFDKGGNGIFVTDDRAGFVQVNKAFCDLLGYSESELLGKTTLDITHPHDMETTRRRMEAIRGGDATGFSVEKRFVRKDGETVWVISNLSLVRNDDGTPRYVIGNIQDITERKRAEEALHHVQKLDALGKLTGGIAHDFNNLLTIILGYIQLMGRELEDGKLLNFATHVEAAAQRGAALTKRLLAFGRRQALEPKIIDLNELVLGLTDMLARTIGTDIEIKTATLPGLHETLADPAEVENVILNLVINARDAMPEGGTLFIETANVRLDEDDAALHGEVTPGDYVMVAVTDTGVGMPADVAGRAFDPFFTTKDMASGSGLGLSMVYGFCRQSGGHAVIESAVGAGTTIRIYLPDAAGDGSGRGAAGDGAWPQKTVLVVEDDPAMRGFAVTTLIGLGYQVLEAADAEVAASVLESNGKIDLLFTDIMLPDGADGRELAASATARHPAIRVLYATGRAAEENSGQRPKPDGVRLLYKPYRGTDLATNIGQLLEGAT